MEAGGVKRKMKNCYLFYNSFGVCNVFWHLYFGEFPHCNPGLQEVLWYKNAPNIHLEVLAVR